MTILFAFAVAAVAAVAAVLGMSIVPVTLIAASVAVAGVLIGEMR